MGLGAGLFLVSERCFLRVTSAGLAEAFFFILKISAGQDLRVLISVRMQK